MRPKCLILDRDESVYEILGYLVVCGQDSLSFRQVNVFHGCSLIVVHGAHDFEGSFKVEIGISRHIFDNAVDIDRANDGDGDDKDYDSRNDALYDLHREGVLFFLSIFSVTAVFTVGA